ncbi:Transcription factor FER-LIKE IRON DEFICIENCY-INDUCED TRANSCRIPTION FACTOR [Nymphaea thermarum]|nr:Transcription factor FER-LIKE IRON DEFICIENCY-INDUCED TRANSCRIPTION FACTOR [Nymphaea thermarum]
MEKLNIPVDNLMALVTGLEEVRQDQEDGRQQPPCTNRLPLLESLLLPTSFDVSTCLPETPFYDAPFTEMGLDQEIACSSSNEELRHHAFLSSSSKSPTPSPPLSRTLLSERRRRGSMKERLLALRSLVPNITKMDKASIIGDAVIYGQRLKKEAVELSQEIVQLESFLGGGETCRLDEVPIPKQDDMAEKESRNRKTVQITLVRVDNCEFYLKIMCNKAKGVVVGLLQVLESLEHVIVQSSNVGSSEELTEAALKLSLLSGFAIHGFGTPRIL